MHEINEGKVISEIEHFLENVGQRYKEKVKKLADPIYNEEGMWGAHYELLHIALVSNIKIIIHKDYINNKMHPIGEPSNPAIHLLLRGEQYGFGHYTSLIPLTETKFTELPVKSAGDCMFVAALQAMKFLQNQITTDDVTSPQASQQIFNDNRIKYHMPIKILNITSDEIKQLRIKVAESIPANDIQASFKHFLFVQSKEASIDARMAIPQSSLLSKAQLLRKKYSEAITASNLLRKAAKEGDLTSLKLIIQAGADVNAQVNYHNEIDKNTKLTALHIAYYEEKNQIIDYLLSLEQTKIDLQDYRGLTALDLFEISAKRNTARPYQQLSQDNCSTPLSEISQNQTQNIKTEPKYDNNSENGSPIEIEMECLAQEQNQDQEQKCFCP